MRDGVSRYKGQWRADLVYHLGATQVCRHVGVYPTEDLARTAYLQAHAAHPWRPPAQQAVETNSDMGDYKPPGV